MFFCVKGERMHAFVRMCRAGLEIVDSLTCQCIFTFAQGYDETICLFCDECWVRLHTCLSAEKYTGHTFLTFGFLFLGRLNPVCRNALSNGFQCLNCWITSGFFLFCSPNCPSSRYCLAVCYGGSSSYPMSLPTHHKAVCTWIYRLLPQHCPSLSVSFQPPFTLNIGSTSIWTSFNNFPEATVSISPYLFNPHHILPTYGSNATVAPCLPRHSDNLCVILTFFQTDHLVAGN